MARLAAAVGALRAAGHAVPWVTTGGTGTAEFCAAHDVVTEVQPGSFVFSDAAYMATGAPYAPALTVTATVISRPAPGRAVVDAGLKTLTDDHGPARLADLPGWTYAHAGDEHGILTGSGEEMMSPSATRGPTSPRPHGVRLGTPLGIGDRVTLIPSHGDTTVNLHDVLHVHRGGVIEAVWPVVARGRVR
jgi:D-serine deaminase-like pyridoxal phosphate-dependent protein